MNEIYLDTETIGLTDAFPDGDDIVYQLSYIIKNETGAITQDGFGKPERYKEMAIEAMETTNITPDDLEEYGPIQETNAWKILNGISSQDSVLFAHNASFDIEVIKRSSIDIMNFKIIDTLKIARFINDNLGLPWDSCRLSYLYYKFELYRDKPDLEKELGINTSDLGHHNAMFDIVSLILLWRYFQKTYGVTIEKALELTSSDLIYKYIPSGKHKGTLISELPYNSLVWYRDNFYDKDIARSCGEYIK